MAKVEHIVCDKCGRETDQKYYIHRVYCEDNNPWTKLLNNLPLLDEIERFERFDLCPKCSEALVAFVAGIAED